MNGRSPELDATRVMLRPIANPFGLGFIGLAGAAIAVSALQLGWAPASERAQTALIVLVVAPIPQLIASVFGFLARDPLASSGMGWLAGSWLAYALVLVSTPAGSTSEVLGVFLIVAAAGLAITAAGAATAKLVPAAVMALAALRFALSAVYELTASHGWGDASGVVGVVLAAAALYAAASLSIEDLKRRTVLPTLRHGRGREALSGDLASQVSAVGNEAGVREQL